MIRIGFSLDTAIFDSVLILVFLLSKEAISSQYLISFEMGKFTT